MQRLCYAYHDEALEVALELVELLLLVLLLALVLLWVLVVEACAPVRRLKSCRGGSFSLLFTMIARQDQSYKASAASLRCPCKPSGPGALAKEQFASVESSFVSAPMLLDQ